MARSPQVGDGSRRRTAPLHPVPSIGRGIDVNFYVAPHEIKAESFFPYLPETGLPEPVAPMRMQHGTAPAQRLRQGFVRLAKSDCKRERECCNLTPWLL